MTRRNLKSLYYTVDTWGGDITTAAILHLAHTAPPKLQFTATDFNRCAKYTLEIADGKSS
jgi:hypothetical protein